MTVAPHMKRALEEAEAEVELWKGIAEAWEKRAILAEAVIAAAKTRHAEHSSAELSLMLAVKAYEEWKP